MRSSIFASVFRSSTRNRLQQFANKILLPRLQICDKRSQYWTHVKLEQGACEKRIDLRQCRASCLTPSFVNTRTNSRTQPIRVSVNWAIRLRSSGPANSRQKNNMAAAVGSYVRLFRCLRSHNSISLASRNNFHGSLVCVPSLVSRDFHLSAPGKKKEWSTWRCKTLRQIDRIGDR